MGLIEWLKEILFGKQDERSIKPETEERNAYTPLISEDKKKGKKRRKKK